MPIEDDAARDAMPSLPAEAADDMPTSDSTGDATPRPKVTGEMIPEAETTDDMSIMPQVTGQEMPLLPKATGQQMPMQPKVTGQEMSPVPTPLTDMIEEDEEDEEEEMSPEPVIRRHSLKHHLYRATMHALGRHY